MLAFFFAFFLRYFVHFFNNLTHQMDSLRFISHVCLGKHPEKTFEMEGAFNFRFFGGFFANKLEGNWTNFLCVTFTMGQSDLFAAGWPTWSHCEVFNWCTEQQPTLTRLNLVCSSAYFPLTWSWLVRSCSDRLQVIQIGAFQDGPGENLVSAIQLPYKVNISIDSQWFRNNLHHHLSTLMYVDVEK